MVMRLALGLGWSPRRVRSELDAADLAEFEDFYAVEPWGCLPDDYRAGLIATCAANANPMRKRAAQLEDMIPRRGPRVFKVQSQAKMMADFNEWAGLNNG